MRLTRPLIRLAAAALALAVAVAASILLQSANRASAANRAAPDLARYAEAVEVLQPFISRQIQENNLPGLSIALVDNQQIVWEAGFGYSDPAHKTPARDDTVYFAGSLSKLITDTTILKLVDGGILRLDEPLTTYIPDFRPRNPFATPITLSQLMAGRSGLVREPPMDLASVPAQVSLADLVARLNQTTLIYWPGTHWKQSDAAYGVLGRVIERASRQPFSAYIQSQVFAPLGMRDSSFSNDSRLVARLAKSTMWSYDERAITPPAIPSRIAPAGGLETTAPDLARFLEALFADGEGRGSSVLSGMTIQRMSAPHFAPRDAKTGLSFGFSISDLAGRRLLTSFGRAPGDSAEIAALPQEKLGVVVMTNLGGAAGVTDHIAEVALQLMVAARHHRRLPKTPESTPFTRESARSIAGRYGSLDDAFDLIDQENRLFFLRLAGGPMVQVRRLGSGLIEDGRLGYGLQLTPIPGGMRIGTQIFPKYVVPKPAEIRTSWRPLIGEYGPESNLVYILEKNGRLTALVEGYEYDPLQQTSPSEFEFPHAGAFDGERAIFLRNLAGAVTTLEIGGATYPREVLGGTEGQFFHITPVRPIAELRREALAAKPPVEHGHFFKPDLVDVTPLDPTIKLDIRYATTHDFVRTPVYTQAKAYMERPAAMALARVSRKLRPLGYGLLIHDAYRPWYVTKIFWDATPLDKKIFVADPSEGSRHNRGCAVDLTLYDLRTGKQVPMTGHYDEMTERSYPFFPGGTSLERWDRNLLRHAMESEGFTVYEFEWWHFDYQGWQHYPILNLTFEQLSNRSSSASPVSHHAPPAFHRVAPAPKEPKE